MPDQPIESGDDDWVRQMLAEAMLSPGSSFSDRFDESTAEEPAEALSQDPPEELPEPVVDDVVPDPVTSSRVSERPMFDATHDPGVDTMVRPEVSERAHHDDEERSSVRGVVEWLVVLGSAVVVALLLRAFLFQAFYIPSASMEETLRIDDRVLVNKLSYRLHDINRGDVVVFHRPDGQVGEFRDLIKRVIGLPGETIEAQDNTIYINGQVLIEPYLTPGEVIADFGPVDIPEGELFVMGDNRDNSGDSRVFGTIDSDEVIGRAFFLFWPVDRIGSL
jgi:signal peptidase I